MFDFDQVPTTVILTYVSKNRWYSVYNFERGVICILCKLLSQPNLNICKDIKVNLFKYCTKNYLKLCYWNKKILWIKGDASLPVHIYIDINSIMFIISLTFSLSKSIWLVLWCRYEIYKLLYKHKYGLSDFIQTKLWNFIPY